jgi:UDP-N-acetylglucosamine--N-acetylmuramyl-(pentapeptide) pyrophosphoryl-undecaprenol N-acetylglucosamine transferase
MNRAVVDALPMLDGIHVIHQTGPREYDAIRLAYAGRAGEVCAFIADMPAAMSRADIVVSRAGASTLAELAAAGKASLLVPFPFASDDHQLQNALARERAGAARLVRDAELTGARLAQEIHAMLPQLPSMEENVRKFAVRDATTRIADAIEKAAS